LNARGEEVLLLIFQVDAGFCKIINIINPTYSIVLKEKDFYYKSIFFTIYA